MAQRIKVSDEHRIDADGTARFVIYDARDGSEVASHGFALVGASAARSIRDWLTANRKVAQAIADALNVAPTGAIESIRLSRTLASRAALVARRETARGLAA